MLHFSSLHTELALWKMRTLKSLSQKSQTRMESVVSYIKYIKAIIKYAEFYVKFLFISQRLYAVLYVGYCAVKMLSCFFEQNFFECWACFLWRWLSSLFIFSFLFWAPPHRKHSRPHIYILKGFGEASIYKLFFIVVCFVVFLCVLTTCKVIKSKRSPTSVQTRFHSFHFF